MILGAGLVIFALTFPLGLGLLLGWLWLGNRGRRTSLWVAFVPLGVIAVGWGWILAGNRAPGVWGAFLAGFAQNQAILGTQACQIRPILTFCPLSVTDYEMGSGFWALLLLPMGIIGLLSQMVAWCSSPMTVPLSHRPGGPPAGATPGTDRHGTDRLVGPQYRVEVPWKALESLPGYCFRVGSWVVYRRDGKQTRQITVSRSQVDVENAPKHRESGEMGVDSAYSGLWQRLWRYRVRVGVIFGWVGAPRYRVIHAKGGVNPAFYTVARYAVHGSLHGNEQLHGSLPGSDIGSWYTVMGSVHGNAHGKWYTRLPCKGPLACIPRIVARYRHQVEPALGEHPAQVPPSPALGTWGHAEPLGSVVLWASPPKTGKTTLLAALADSSCAPVPWEVLGMRVARSGLVALSEESPDRSVLGTIRTGPGRCPVLVKAGPQSTRGVRFLPEHLAQVLWLARTAERLTGCPVRRVVLDSLFHWCPEAETDTRAAKAAMAALRALATFTGDGGAPLVVDVVCHSDPDSGRLKGPQQTWAQADYRLDLAPRPKTARPEDTPTRVVHWSGRFVPPETRPPDAEWTLAQPLRPESISHRETPPQDAKREHVPGPSQKSRVLATVLRMGPGGALVPAAAIAAALNPEDRPDERIPRSTVYRLLADLASPGDNRLRVKVAPNGQKSYGATVDGTEPSDGTERSAAIE